MKKSKTTSKLYILFVVMIFVSLACFIAALCVCNYDFSGDFVSVYNANKAFFILAGVSVDLDVALIISAIVLWVKNDELTRSEVSLAFQVAIVLLLEVVLCVPIFIIWVIEKIHDAISYTRRENI